MSYDGMTDPLGQSQVLPYLVGLSKIGYQFTLISFEKQDRFQSHRSTIERICEEAKIQWIPLSYTKYPPVLSTLSDIRTLRNRAYLEHKKNNFHLIHCRSYITALIGLDMKRKFGSKFLFDMRGFFADERVEGGIWNLKNPIHSWIYKYFKKKERKYFLGADHTVSLTKKGKEVIQRLYPSDKPITVIPCCADLDLFDYKNIDTERLDKLRNDLGISKEDFVLHYLGSIGTWYMLTEMLDFFRVLLNRRTNSVFLFTSGDSREDIMSYASSIGIPSEKIILQRADRQDVPYHIALADLGIFFIKPVFSKMASSPTKQGEMMGMGLPIVCNNNVGDTGEIINSTKTGVAINEFNNDVYLEVINSLDKLLKIPKVRVRKAALDFYSLKYGVKKYRDVYEQIRSL